MVEGLVDGPAWKYKCNSRDWRKLLIHCITEWNQWID